MDAPHSIASGQDDHDNRENVPHVGITAADIFSAFAVAAAMGALYFVIGFSLHVLAATIDQHIVSYEPLKWFGYGHDYESVFVGMIIGLLMFIIVCVDMRVRLAQAKELLHDVAYFPRLWKSPNWVSSPKACMTIILGFPALAVYYALFALEVFRQGQGAVVVAPNRLFFVLLFAWGMLWFADCLIRRDRGTILAARLFLLTVFLLAVGFASTDEIFRE
jgi:hypothetical protein